MLKLKKINKSYKTGEFKQHALKDVTIEFRKNEFVAILGPSGSGKTTLLNIIGGLDRYDNGDLIINNQSTKEFDDSNWDAYRNNCIGFIFQSYNLINHISILENVEMSLTLSGVDKKEKKQRAIEALTKVGLKSHIHKKPNQLSGGQMQRVAIARSLVNNPEIILADEPTGALDTKTSKQIMDLIKETAQDKLVIMVTHNPELAKNYATRIIEFKDGSLISDSKPIKKKEKNKEEIHIKKTSMNFLTALNLSFNNIKTKKGRTALTAFASSIGIIGIALILSLSNGFDIQIDKFERETLSQSPIIISEQAMSMSEENIAKVIEDNNNLEKYPTDKKVFVQDDLETTMMHTNNISNEYVDYIKKISQKDISGISYQTATNFNIINYNEETGYQLVNSTTGLMPWTLIPTKEDNTSEMLETNYDVLAGEIDTSSPGLILQVDPKNRVYASTLKQLGFTSEDEVDFEDILNKELKLVLNDDYYKKVNEFYIPNQDLEALYNNENSITIKVQAIIRGKEDKEILTSTSAIAYTNALTDIVIENNKGSSIVNDQKESDYNVLTNQPFTEDETKETILSYLGAETTPVAIYIYPKDFESKDNIISYLDKYNEKKEEKDTIQYTDMAQMVSSLTGNIMNAVTIVLISFSAISLIVSSIMIGIITYISVLERTKEIGILRALGARKKDITRVFNAETFIIGLVSGIIGILITCILLVPANILLENLTNLENVAQLNPLHALILMIVSISLTLIGGFIPAKLASKKDPVEALRTE